MTEKKFESLDGLVGFNRGDKPHAVAFAKNLFVNTEPKVKEFSNGNKVLEFLSTIQGDYSKDTLEKMAKGQLQSTEYGVTANLTIDISHPNREKYLKDLLVKGARIESAMIDFVINQGQSGTFLNGSIRGLGKVVSPTPKQVEPQPAVADSSDDLGF